MTSKVAVAVEALVVDLAMIHRQASQTHQAPQVNSFARRLDLKRLADNGHI